MPVKQFFKSALKIIDFTAITKTNQGAGSGLDSDLLDGLHGSAYEQVANKDVNSGYAGLNASGLVIRNPASKGQANGLAELDSGGKIPSSQLPALALTNIWTVASQAAQLALVAQEGDVAIRTDLNKSYAHNSGTAGTMADWSELLTPTDTVLSVFGRTGAVAAAEGDYTLNLLGDVVITTPATGQGLRYNGTSWVNAQFAHGDLSAIGTNTHTQIDTHLGASSGVHGVSGSLVGTTDVQTLTNKSFGSDTIVKEKGTATAINDRYDSYDLTLRSSSWRSGVEVKRDWSIRNVGHPTTDYLRFIAPDATVPFELSQGANFHITKSHATEIQEEYVINGVRQFLFDIYGQSVLTAYNPLLFYGSNIQRLTLDSTGSTFYGDVFLSNGYLKPANVSLPAAGSTYRGKIARVEGAAGVADEEFICRKGITDVYNWQRLNSGEGHITILPWAKSGITQGTWTFFNIYSSQALNNYATNSSATNLDQIDYKVYLAPGTYSLALLSFTSSNRGIINILLDGTSVGTADMYSASTVPNVIVSITGIAVTTGGLKTLSVKVDGKNVSSTGYNIDLSSISLWRTA